MDFDVTTDTGALLAEKDKDATKTYRFAMAGVLAPGDSVTAATWQVAPAGGVSVASSLFDDASITVALSGGTENTWYAATCSWTAANGDANQFTLRLFVGEDAETGLTGLGSALFPNKFAAIAKMRRDRLLLLARSLLPDLVVSDDYIWDKVRAAEAAIAHRLRVPLGPTRFFATEPSQAEIDALNGMPWEIDPPYDWEPENFLDSKWGYMLLRNKPLIDVISVRVAYPSIQNTVLNVPLDWVRLDKKYGHLNLVPSSPMAMQTFGATLMPMISAGRRLPFSVHVNYTAGLKNTARDYPDLIDAVLKTAAIGIIEDSYLPQSGSISADGLSQSMSVDAGKYHETIDRLIDGGEGGNGGLMAKIHGVRMLVM